MNQLGNLPCRCSSIKQYADIKVLAAEHILVDISPFALVRMKLPSEWALHWFLYTKNILKLSARQIKNVSAAFSGFSKARSSGHLDCWILPWAFLSWFCLWDDLIQYSKLVTQGDRRGLINMHWIWELDFLFTSVKLLFALCCKLLWLRRQLCLSAA